MAREIDFTLNNAERYLVDKIVDRAVKIAGGPRKCDKLSLTMDIAAVHCNGNPLRLEEMLRADDFNLAHDVFGIQRHLNRETGKLGGHFLPRFSSATPRKKIRVTVVNTDSRNISRKGTIRGINANRT